MLEADQCTRGAYAACYRYSGAIARHLIATRRRVALIGAGRHGQVRQQDQMCCAWLIETLVKVGHRPVNAQATEITERWSRAPATACETGIGLAYLRRSGQLDDSTSSLRT